MTEKEKQVHDAFCNYEIAKANQRIRVRTYSAYKQQKTLGIRTSGLSKAMLAMQLASLFQYKEKENKQMAVIIKLNGIYIGATTMTTNEIRNAKNAGFTILTRNEGR